MSRMTKFLRQKCRVQPYEVDAAGKPVYNDFGELQYQPAKICNCRHEISFQDVQTSSGQLVKSTSRYFLDESLEIKADYKIDGRAVLSVSSYVNGLGLCEGYEVYV